MMLEKTLESLLDCKEIQSVHPKGDQSWVFIGRTMLKLKLQYFGHLMQRVDSLEKTLMLGGLGGKRRRGWQRMRWLDGINDSMGMGLGRLREFVMDREAWCADSWGCRVGHDWATELNWTELKPLIVQGSTVFPYNLAHPLVYFKSSLDYLKYFAVVVHSVVSNSLQPHGQQHARLPCPSPSAGACSNSCSLSQRCHPTILSSIIPFFCIQSFSASGFFQCHVFVSGGQSIGASALASVLPKSIQDWFLLGLTGLVSLLPKGLSRVFSNINFLVVSLPYGPTLTSIHDYQKNHSFDYMETCWQNNDSAF